MDQSQPMTSGGHTINTAESTINRLPVKHDDGSFDLTTDVLIVGSGCAGLTAALRLQSQGVACIVVEKSSQLGGATAYSGGSLWIPGNSVTRREGVKDSFSDALRYFDACVGDVGPVSSQQRRKAFLKEGPRMIDFLESIGFQWKFSQGYPDYYPEKPGAMPHGGRTIEPAMFNMKRLGEWEDSVLCSKVPDSPMLACEATRFTRPLASIWDFIYSTTLLANYGFAKVIRGHRPVGLGRSLVSQLVYLCRQRGIEIWCDSPFIDLIQGDDTSRTVLGARIERGGATLAVRATQGVLLCAGGFARNQEMRNSSGQGEAKGDWSLTPAEDLGDAILAGMRCGADTALLGHASWAPVIRDPRTCELHITLLERGRPFCIIVDSKGERFMNEAQSYVDCGYAQFSRHKEVSAIPAWLVMDTRHRNRYLLASLMPRMNSSRLFTAATIHELAEKIGVDVAGLVRTVTSYNEMCKTGVDLQFGKGATTYDNFFGDPSVGPNPNMGPIEASPFYATEVWPGDIGTKGGLLTDECARVLTKDGRSIPGLFAAGNTAASIMGKSYIGAGSTLGPAMAFGFIAADTICTSSR
ncbi:hypothetical protein ACHAPA_012248 [Fusarium lateritium]